MTKPASSRKKLGIVQTPHPNLLQQYRIGFLSRQASLLGRREVLSGKAKFGIFGDGKEVAQLAMANAFRKGDWRSGYYRDQTFMLAIDSLTVREFFAQLYADTNLENEPNSGGRQMNSHFATRYLDQRGEWLKQCLMYNSSADLSPTAAQMGRSLGLAYASKLYRQNKNLESLSQFSVNGQEVSFVTIGNASTSEGIFWETINAAGVLQVPLVCSVWDDDYGISVPAKYQTTKESISTLLKGFASDGKLSGVDIYTVKGWDYQALVDTYAKAVERSRHDHIPCVVHVTEMTQPQGHSTSGSHERYKTPERLALEENRDCLKRMRQWLIESGNATESELAAIEREAVAQVEQEKSQAWQDWSAPMMALRDELVGILEGIDSDACAKDIAQLKRTQTIFQRQIHSTAVRNLVKLKHALPHEASLRGDPAAGSGNALADLQDFIAKLRDAGEKAYSTKLTANGSRSPLNISNVPKSAELEDVAGHEVIQKFFTHAMARDPRIFIIGEDVGALGGVNSEFKGIQEQFGEIRITDTGIREATILGQGLGAAMRGLKPIVDIQYLDYLLYCFQLLSDDLATLHYRSAGGQIAPCIVRTKGHRLEGIWHTGSPMGVIIHGLRGMHVCVPRDMVQAAGMYQTLLQGDDPALVIEVLNGYRIKEQMPKNVGEYTVPLGQIEVLKTGQHITLVTYGACVRVALDAAALLSDLGIDLEVIDVQTLLPFDLAHSISSSIQKTNAVIFMDEDVPGGASAYMLQQVLEGQKAYEFLDAQPRTLTAKPHRSPYGSDGDYYSKPSAEDVVELCLEMMHERFPHKW